MIIFGLFRSNPYHGNAGVDFPTYNSIPRTAFDCHGLAAGYYADQEAGCQVSPAKKFATLAHNAANHLDVNV